MKTKIASTRTLPFELGEARSFGGLTIVPLFPARAPEVGYVGLDEAVARGLTVSEVGGGVVEALLLENPLSERVLLYEGEELLGAKQNRIVERTILVEARSTLKIPVNCVEQGRWAWGSARLAPAPQTAYPELRLALRHGQHAVWESVAAKQGRFAVHAPTGAAEAIYRSRDAELDEYLRALPRLPGQAGALVAIAGRVCCLDYVSRSEVFAGLYRKLLRGYALDALERPVERPLSKAAVGRFLGELELADRAWRPAVGLGEEGRFAGYAVGSELVVEGEVLALGAFRAATSR